MFQKWFLSIGTALLVAWATWASSAIVDAQGKANASESVQIRIEQRLDRIESKLDRLIESQVPYGWDPPKQRGGR